MNKKELQQHFDDIIGYFEREMPVAESELHFENPFQLLVAVMLSAQCTDKRVNMVTPALFQKMGTPQAMAAAEVEDILQLVKSISYPNSKAAHLSEMAKMLVAQFGGVVPQNMDDLQKLPGVGRKTANVMMAVAFGKPAMPVDTHVFRVAERLGLSQNAKTPLETEQQLVAHIPAEKLSKAHHWLLLHGRYTCTAKNPKCATCGLAPQCPTKNKKVVLANF